ncbi:methyltransferase [Arcanobacterium hippocoleae]
MSEHYFSAETQSPAIEKSVNILIRDREYQVTTMPGVFSHDGIDKGTAVFLRKVPLTTLPEFPKVLDLGCGWGPISLALGTAYPQADLFAVDVNERALELCKMNLAAAGLKGEVVCEPELAARFMQDGTRLDLIWSNPPIRIGKAELHQLLLRWLSLLAPNGTAYFVVQKNLGADSLSKWLKSQGYIAEKIGSAKGFRVIEVRCC